MESIKIVHHGIVYVIPTCTCGWWKSGFRMCLCIVKALRESGHVVWAVENVPPVHLIWLHPVWGQALEKCKRDDYAVGKNVQIVVNPKDGEKICMPL